MLVLYILMWHLCASNIDIKTDLYYLQAQTIAIMTFFTSFFNKPRLPESAKFSIIDREHLNITPHELGSGSYGTVYAAEYDGQPCVAKEMHTHLSHQNDEVTVEMFYKELNTLALLRHINIVQFLGVHFRTMSSPPTLVIERMWKSLSDLLEEQPNQLPLLIKAHILYDVACGLQYLHGQKKPVVHRDLNANSVFLTKNLDAKIGDLGQAKALEKVPEQILSRSPRNVACTAPEALSKAKSTYNSKLDIFSFGCTIIHVITEEFPTPTDLMSASEDNPDLYVKVPETDRRIKFLDLMDSASRLLKQIAYDCLQDAPSSRPTPSNVCKELREYIKNLEKRLSSEAQRCKQDKLSLLCLLKKSLEEKEGLDAEVNIKEKVLKTKEVEVTKVEQSLKELEQKLKQFEEEKKSLLEKMSMKDEVNKQLTVTFNRQECRLRDDLNAEQEEIKATKLKLVESQNEIHSLQSQLKEEARNFFEEKHRVADLTMQLQKAKKIADDYKHKFATVSSELARQEGKYRTELNQLKTENCKRVEDFVDQLKEKEEVIAQLNKKLEENDTVIEEYKVKNADLHQKYRLNNPKDTAHVAVDLQCRTL